MKYKVGDKFLIEIGDIYENEFPFGNEEGSPSELFKIKGFNSLVFDKRGLNKLQRVTTPEQDEKAAEIDRAYNLGLNDAWELARKIIVNPVDGGYSISELRDIFGKGITNIVCGLTAKEAISKVEDYENKKIKVGDVVDNNALKGIVTMVKEKDVDIMFKDGSVGTWDKRNCKKTGEHIDISSILQEIGKE